MKNIELLAPVGSYDALIAAVQNGADAVYLAGPDFGARKFAKNFTRETLVEAIEYSHIRGVDVYVTVNTLIKDSEWQGVIEYVDFLYTNDVDAIIVQDMGLADYISSQYPDLALHASTQMSAHNLDDIKFLKSFGFSRVVVAREMPIEEIKLILDQVEIELEVFVHGALCISYSGQCLMSSVIGGRSGNRGRCAQPCRQVYQNDETKDYALSPRDLNSIESIEALKKIGVASLKIEGRMKGPEYAATTVGAYRNAIDLVDEPNHLEQIFNRSYTKGFLMSDEVIATDAPGNRGEYVGVVDHYDGVENRLYIKMEKMINKGDEIQIRRATSNIGTRTDVFYFNHRRTTQYKLEDIIAVEFKHFAKPGEKIYRTFDQNVMKNAKQTYHKEFRKTPLKGFVSLYEGSAAYMTFDDGINKVTAMSEQPVEKALKVTLDQARVTKQVSKLGSTPYILESVEIDLEDGVSVPAKVLNDLRHNLTDQLDALRKKRYTRTSNVDKRTLNNTEKTSLELAVSVRTKEQYDAIRDLDIEKIYCYDLSTDAIPRLHRITPTKELEKIKASLKDYSGPILVGNYGQLMSFDQSIPDYSMNIFNSHSIAVYESLETPRATVSYEMSRSDIAKIKSTHTLEKIVYGYTPVMVMKYCPITKQNTHCDTCHEPCKNHHMLEDRFEAKYPMIRSNDHIEILGSRRLHLIDHLSQLKGHIDIVRLDFTIETPEEVRDIVLAYQDKMLTGAYDLTLENVSYGHFNDGVE